MKNFQYYLERVSEINETYTYNYPDAEKTLETIIGSVSQETGKTLTDWKQYAVGLESISKHPKSSVKFLKYYDLFNKKGLEPADIFATIKQVANDYARKLSTLDKN